LLLPWIQEDNSFKDFLGLILPICHLIIYCFHSVNLLFNDMIGSRSGLTVIIDFCSNFDASKNPPADRTTIALKATGNFSLLVFASQYSLASLVFDWTSLKSLCSSSPWSSRHIS
jgi:hypothetical protein